MPPPLGRLIIYTKKMDAMVQFYCRHFGFEALQLEGDRIVELRAPDTGVSLLLHPASKRQKDGQPMVKLVFDVEDVTAFCKNAQPTDWCSAKNTRPMATRSRTRKTRGTTRFRYPAAPSRGNRLPRLVRSCRQLRSAHALNTR